MSEQRVSGIGDFLVVDTSSPTGLRWIKRPKYSKVCIGDVAFTSVGHSAPGYYQGMFNGVQLKAHRVVFFLTHGYWSYVVDHLDGNPLNNNPANLRACSLSENQHNVIARGTRRNGKSWQVNIQVDGKRQTFGAYATEELAHAAYLEAKRILHPTAPERCYVKD